MITVEKVLKDIEGIMKDKLGFECESEITPDTSFLKDGLGISSVMLLELIIELELLYEIELDEDELTAENFERAASIAELIIGKIEAK